MAPGGSWFEHTLQAQREKMLENVVERIQKSGLFVGLFILPSFRWFKARKTVLPVFCQECESRVVKHLFSWGLLPLSRLPALDETENLDAKKRRDSEKARW